jgi:hypothetical protein
LTVTTGHTSTIVITSHIPDGADRDGRNRAPDQGWFKSSAALHDTNTPVPEKYQVTATLGGGAIGLTGANTRSRSWSVIEPNWKTDCTVTGAPGYVGIVWIKHHAFGVAQRASTWNAELISE